MDSIKRGKVIVAALSISTLLLSIVTIALTYSVNISIRGEAYASEKLGQGMVRAILTVILLAFLYKGRKWARGIVAVLSLVTGISVVAILVSTFNIILLVMAATYLCFSGMLIFSTDVDNFLVHQQGQESKLI